MASGRSSPSSTRIRRRRFIVLGVVA